MNKEVLTQEQIEEQEALARSIAEVSGENTNTYAILPTITVFNPNGDSESEFKIGDLIKTTRTQQGYNQESFGKPFTGIIVKTRMFLKLKYKYAEGKPKLITNEFDSYAESCIITVKEKGLEPEAKYEEVTSGNYRAINDEYSLKNAKGEVEDKKLELHHAIYVLTDAKEVIRIDSKGFSRSNYIEYMNSFSRQGLDRMSTTKTEVSSMISTETYDHKARKAPIAALSFTKKEHLTLDEMKELKEFQTTFEADLKDKDVMFGNAKKEAETGNAQLEQPEPKESLPTIQLDDEEVPAELPLGVEEEKDAVDIADVPFK